MVLMPVRRAVFAAYAALTVGACGREEPEPPSPPASDTVEPLVASVGGLQARRTDLSGIVADLLSAEREEGLLTLSVRFRNTGTDTVEFAIPADGGTYPTVRLEAGGRAWAIAREQDGDPAAPREFAETLKPGDSMLWRASFEAPPRTVTAFDLAMPRLREPFEGVPISDPPFESRAEEMEERGPPAEP